MTACTESSEVMIENNPFNPHNPWPIYRGDAMRGAHQQTNENGTQMVRLRSPQALLISLIGLIFIRQIR